jgi:hypothetical protein
MVGFVLCSSSLKKAATINYPQAQEMVYVQSPRSHGIGESGLMVVPHSSLTLRQEIDERAEYHSPGRGYLYAAAVPSDFSRRSAGQGTTLSRHFVKPRLLRVG